jgi:hypothetical protein
MKLAATRFYSRQMIVQCFLILVAEFESIASFFRSKNALREMLRLGIFPKMMVFIGPV